jgi:hypothetical protein
VSYLFSVYIECCAKIGLINGINKLKYKKICGHSDEKYGTIQWISPLKRAFAMMEIKNNKKVLRAPRQKSVFTRLKLVS